MRKRLLHVANGELSHLACSDTKLSCGVPILAGQERFRLFGSAQSIRLNHVRRGKSFDLRNVF